MQHEIYQLIIKTFKNITKEEEAKEDESQKDKSFMVEKEIS